MSQSETDNNPPETTEDTEHAKNIREAWEWLREFRDQRTAEQKSDALRVGIMTLHTIFPGLAPRAFSRILDPDLARDRLIQLFQTTDYPQSSREYEGEFWVLGSGFEINSRDVNLDPPTSCQSLGFHRVLHVGPRDELTRRLPSARESNLNNIRSIVAANHGQEQINPQNQKWASPWQFVLEKEGGLRTGFEVVFRPPDSTVSSGGIRHLLMTLTIRNWYPLFWKDEKDTESILEVQRETAKLPGRKFDVRVKETRMFVCLQLVSFGDVMAYSLTGLSDDLRRPHEDSWGGKNGEKTAGFYGKAVGVYEFLRRIRLSLNSCRSGWEWCLREIDLLNGVRVRASDEENAIIYFGIMFADKGSSKQMGDSLDEEKWNSFMFDESFRLSKTCFSVVQLLRIADGWVEETQKDVNRLTVQLREILDVFEPSIRQRLETDLDILEKEVQEGMGDIRNRISRKSEQSKTLQDVLFNTTSIREATRGMALNRAIYVFTAVTVIYTPLAFVVALWALPFLNHENEDGSTPAPSGVIATSIAIPVVTYVFASLFALYVGSARFRNLLSASWYWILKLLYRVTILSLNSRLESITLLGSLLQTLLSIIWASLPKKIQEELEPQYDAD